LKLSSHDSFAFLWNVVRPFRRNAIAVVALVIVDTILASMGIGMILPVFQAMLTPDVNNSILNTVLPVFSRLSIQNRIVFLSFLLILIFGLKAIVSLLRVVMVKSFSEKLRLHWIMCIGHRYMYSKYATLASQKQGVLLNNWLNEPGAGSRFFLSYMTMMTSLFLVMGLTLLGFLIKWEAMLALLCLAAIVILAMQKRTFRTAASLGNKKLDLQQKVSASMTESLTNFREVKLLSAEKMQLNHLEKFSDKLKSVFVRIGVFSELPRIIGEFLAVGGLMGFMIIGVVVLKANPQTLLPLVTFFIVAFYRLMTAGSELMASRMKVLNDFHSVSLVHQLATSSEDLEDHKNGLPIKRIESDIIFNDITFAFDNGKPVLRDLNFIIPRGKVVFLVGPSGAGKSTILDLLLRLQKIQSGQILVNGISIEKYSLSQWRKCFGYISQEALLFNGTITMNLRIANPNADSNEIIEACKLAGAHEFISQLPGGYETQIGDRGFSLSGGQRKRVAIARALLQKPEVLILDEATTSFEQEIENKIIHQLVQSFPEMTIIQVTHRLQSAVHADLLLVLENGNARAETWDEFKKYHNSEAYEAISR
jgi:ABC-type multidrug transport system fused ATPase/permease subunit